MNDVILAKIIETEGLTLQQLCQLLRLGDEVVVEMIEQELIVPQGDSEAEWRFNSICIKRARIAASFHRDLKVNMPGVALALDLLDRVDQLQQQVDILRKHLRTD